MENRIKYPHNTEELDSNLACSACQDWTGKATLRVSGCVLSVVPAGAQQESVLLGAPSARLTTRGFYCASCFVFFRQGQVLLLVPLGGRPSAYVQYCDATVIMLAKLTPIEQGRLTVSAILAMLLQAEATRVHKLAHLTVSPVPPELLTWRDTHTGLVCSVEVAMEPQPHHPPRPGSSVVYLCWKWLQNEHGQTAARGPYAARYGL